MSKLSVILGVIELSDKAWKTAIAIRKTAIRNRELTEEEINQLDRRLEQSKKMRNLT